MVAPSARGSVAGKMFAGADMAPAGFSVTNDGPLEVPPLKMGGRLGALVPAGAKNSATMLR
eukprot:3880482-Pyramimonas_sp.AAC.1